MALLHHYEADVGLSDDQADREIIDDAGENILEDGGKRAAPDAGSLPRWKNVHGNGKRMRQAAGQGHRALAAPHYRPPHRLYR